MTAFHLTRPGQKLESTAVRRAVGPFVASSSNIFALAAPDKSDLPSDLRDDITRFAAAYKVENEPAETRHLKLYAGYLRGFARSTCHLVAFHRRLQLRASGAESNHKPLGSTALFD